MWARARALVLACAQAAVRLSTATAAAAADACCACAVCLVCAVGARCWSFLGPGARQLLIKATFVCFLPPTPQYQYNWRHNHETAGKSGSPLRLTKKRFPSSDHECRNSFIVFNWEMYQHQIEINRFYAMRKKQFGS